MDVKIYSLFIFLHFSFTEMVLHKETKSGSSMASPLFCYFKSVEKTCTGMETAKKGRFTVMHMSDDVL